MSGNTEASDPTLKPESQIDVRNQGRNVERNPDANEAWDTD